jgi:phage shock protein PspC (stress-responsive transcriptional regulator)
MSSIWTIRRSTSDAKLAGVCGGVADHWNVDPLLVRIGCVLLALSGGIGLVLYAAGWLLIPVEGSDKPVVADVLGESAGRISREVWLVIVVIACIVSFAVLGSVTPFGFGPALILALIWYFGYYRPKIKSSSTIRPPAQQTPPAVPAPPPTQFYSYSGPPTAFTQAADAWRERVIQVQRDTAAQQSAAVVPPNAPGPVRPPDPNWGAEPEDRSEPTGWARPPEPTDQQAFLAHPDPVGLYAPQPDPSTPARTPARIRAANRPSAKRLRLIGLVALGLTLSGLAIADTLGATVPLLTYLAAALLVIGLTLVAATWFGRARGILPVGVVLAMVTAGVAATPQLPAPAEWQTQQIAYTRVADLPAAGDHRDTGGLDVDLSKLALTKDTTYTADVDLGQLRVTVPPTTNVVVDYSVDAGKVTTFGTQRASGTDLHHVLPADPGTPGQPTLTLKLRADVGQIEVTR